MDYWYVINQKSDINFTIGSMFSNQQFDSDIFQFFSESNYIYDPTPIINGGIDSNDVNYTFNDTYLGIHYRYKTGIFTFTPGISAHTYSTKNEQLGVEYKDNFFRFLPDFNTRIQLKKSEQVTLNYRMQTQFTDVSNFASGLILNSYGSLYSGNPDLASALSHNVNLSYFSFNMF